MGETAEMMLDGILDANGEYTGRNPGHPVYPKGWFGKEKGNSWPQVSRVKCFLGCRGIETGQPQKDMVEAYGNHIGTDRPTQHACSNWPTFKEFVDKKIGYIKPSKIKS